MIMSTCNSLSCPTFQYWFSLDIQECHQKKDKGKDKSLLFKTKVKDKSLLIIKYKGKDKSLFIIKDKGKDKSLIVKTKVKDKNVLVIKDKYLLILIDKGKDKSLPIIKDKGNEKQIFTCQDKGKRQKCTCHKRQIFTYPNRQR